MIIPLFLKPNLFFISLTLMCLSMCLIAVSLFPFCKMWLFSGLFYLDSYSLILVILTMWVFALIFIFLVKTNSIEKIKIMSFTSLVVILFFIVDKMFLFFFLFELSLFPIMFLIMGWGAQPERIKAGWFLILYTLFASIPLLLTILYFFKKQMIVQISFTIFMKNNFWESLIFLGLSIAFYVKTPMFIFHAWLPKAHVEAPLEGSMFLASIMLKMGTYGLVRSMLFIPTFCKSNLMNFLMSISITGSWICAWLASSSDDMKATIAFSSISHMNFMLSNFFLFKVFSLKSTLLVTLSHGLVSSVLFYNVTMGYYMTNSRSLIISKGFGSVFPIFSMLSFFGWAMNMAAPPSISFLGEIIEISIIICSVTYMMGFIIMYVMFSSFYSMFNYSVQNHSNDKQLFKPKLISLSSILIVWCLMFPNFVLFFCMPSIM